MAAAATGGLDELPVGKKAGGGFGSEFPGEQPVGKGSGGGFGSEFPGELPPGAAPPTSAANPEADKPLKDRLVSKNWSVRASAFDDLKGEINGFP